ncbi:hypothetical protein FACS189481_2400 [Clostridia bacterium]|nr:hypothetical protein FACS189481_2400 [Clostridia bacterium]
MNDKKKRLQKVLCVFLSVASVFSVVTPISYAQPGFFTQTNGFVGLELNGEDKSYDNELRDDSLYYVNRNVKPKSEEANSKKIGPRGLWAENVMVAIKISPQYFRA